MGGLGMEFGSTGVGERKSDGKGEWKNWEVSCHGNSELNY